MSAPTKAKTIPYCRAETMRSIQRPFRMYRSAHPDIHAVAAKAAHSVNASGGASWRRLKTNMTQNRTATMQPAQYSTFPSLSAMARVWRLNMVNSIGG